MIAPAVRDVLTAQGVRYCVIGAYALAARGAPRFTADVDLLTMDERVLETSWWSTTSVDVRRGDDQDPLRGVVRCHTNPPLDLIVGRGAIMTFAVDTAEHDGALGAPVVTAVALGLLKLEAGSPRDIADVVSLIDATRALRADDSLLGELRQRAPLLSAWGQRAWARLLSDLDEPTRP